MPTIVDLPGNYFHGFTSAQIDAVMASLVAAKIKAAENLAATGGRVVSSASIQGESMSFASGGDGNLKSIAEIEIDAVVARAQLAGETAYYDHTRAVARFRGPKYFSDL